jgi:hypothetical protein
MDTQFPSTSKDLEYVFRMTDDYCNRFFPVIPYRRLITSITETDDIHDEILETDKRWQDAVVLRAFVQPSLVKQPMNRFGVEDMRTISCKVSVPSLVSAKLAEIDDAYRVVLIAQPGDHIEYSDRIYQVNSIVPEARWANTDLILYFSIEAELYRSSIADFYI